MAQSGAGKLDQWRGYITILPVNHGIIKSIIVLTAVICPIMKFNVDTLRDCFRSEVKRTLAIGLHLSTLSALDVGQVHHLSHAPLQETDTDCMPEGNQSIRNALQRIQSGGDHNAPLCCPLLIE